MPHENSANHSSTPQTGIQGVPAITPHLNLAANAASIASGGNATQPTFTADDASAWVTAHLLPAYQEAYGTVTISSVTFLPNDQAGQWLKLGDLGLPAGTPLCVVVLDGSFGLIMPWTSSPIPATPATYSHTVLVFLVFNGVTGNLLVRSAPPPPPPGSTATPTTPGTPTPVTSTPATPTTGTTPTTNTTPGTDTPPPSN